MRRPSNRNWTTQFTWLVMGAAISAPIALSQNKNWDPSAGLQRTQQTEDLYRQERWAPGSPYPLTQFEQRMRAVQMQPMPSELNREPVQPGIVSVKELRDPISKRDARLLAEIQKELQSDGHRESALRRLDGALSDPRLADHARAILGIDALRQGEIDAAVKSLSESARRMPNNASVHAYLGVALAASGWIGMAEDELRRALALQPHLAIAQYTLGVLLLNQPQRYLEASQCLRGAEAEIPQARMALAVLYALSGEHQRMRDTVEATGADDAPITEQWVLAVSNLPQPSVAFGVQSRGGAQSIPQESAPRDLSRPQPAQ